MFDSVTKRLNLFIPDGSTVKNRFVQLLGQLADRCNMMRQQFRYSVANTIGDHTWLTNSINCVYSFEIIVIIIPSCLDTGLFTVGPFVMVYIQWRESLQSANPGQSRRQLVSIIHSGKQKGRTDWRKGAKVVKEQLSFTNSGEPANSCHPLPPHTNFSPLLSNDSRLVISDCRCDYRVSGNKHPALASCWVIRVRRLMCHPPSIEVITIPQKFTFHFFYISLLLNWIPDTSQLLRLIRKWMLPPPTDVSARAHLKTTVIFWLAVNHRFNIDNLTPNVSKK